MSAIAVASPAVSPAAARSAPRVPARARGCPKTQRKPARPAPPRIPEDFFSKEAHALLTDLLITRAQRWQAEGAPPIYYYGRDSEPLWDAAASHRCSGTTLRRARQAVLYESLAVDLERGLRLLTLDWTQEHTAREGRSVEAWRAALSGVLWRVGQLLREFTRRKGAERAREVLRLVINTLWW